MPAGPPPADIVNHITPASGNPRDSIRPDFALAPVILDASDPVQIAEAARRASDVTVVLNNAGYCSNEGMLAEQAIANARAEIDVNYIGALGVARVFAPVISASGGGAIISVLSFLSLVTLPLLGTYSASKAAALSMTRSLRAELAPQGVAVLAAMPVQVDTPTGSWWDGPRVAPDEAASDILDALETGEDEVFAGALSREAAAKFEADPKAFQARLLGLGTPHPSQGSPHDLLKIVR
jgi:short-subunit dehydrogenase